MPDPMDSVVRLQPCAGIDLVGINPTPLAVTRQSAVTCVAFHPELPLLGIATGTFICGSRGALYFVKLGKEVVRTASFHRGDILDAQGKPLKDKGGSWGLRVKHEAPKPILGLAAHPSEPLLLLLSSDGQLRGFNVVADDAVSPTFSVQ
ncbi:hypothetical protein HaLaN_31390, partial [Haematococcus lacustris]